MRNWDAFMSQVDQPVEVLSLQDYLAVLRRRRWLIAVVTTIVVVSALTTSFLMTPIYEGTTEVVVEPVRRSQEVSLENLLSTPNAAVATEQRVITSRAVAERVADLVDADDVGDLLDNVEVTAVRDTRVVEIRFRDPDPVRAAATADAFAAAYLDLRRDQAVDEMLRARSSLEQRADDLRRRIIELDEGLRASEPDPVIADEDDEGDVEPPPVADDAGDLGLQVERDALIAQLAQVSAQIAEFGAGSEAVVGGGAVLNPAEIPQGPVEPNLIRNGALAIVLGVLLGVGLAFLRDHLDDLIRDEDDFKRATGGLPVIGRIPEWNDKSKADRFVTLVEPSSQVSDTYRELSASLRFMLLTHGDTREARGGRGYSVLLTSALAGDGKTSTATNLAVTAARAGLRTVLVDADLRRSSIGRRLGLARASGLSDVLLEGDRVSTHSLKVGIDNLVVLAAGTTPPNPNELLASSAMRQLHEFMVGRADLVIYDTPAVLAVPDALELAHYVDVVILVGRANQSRRRQLSAAMERLAQAGANLRGTVFNGVGDQSEYYYAYYDVDDSGRPLRRRDRTARAKVNPVEVDQSPGWLWGSPADTDLVWPPPGEPGVPQPAAAEPPSPPRA